MTDYLPKFPGRTETRTASSAVDGGQLVAVSAADTVAKTDGATTAWLGVAAFPAGAGDRVTVHIGGTQRLVASGSIGAGAQVIPASEGRVAALAVAAAGDAADVNAARQLVGTAQEPGSDGDRIEVVMSR